MKTGKLDIYGEVDINDQSAFCVILSARQYDIAVTTDTTVAFDSERFDRTDDFNTTTYTFTAPKDGKYQFNINLSLLAVPANSTFIQCRLITSNKTYIKTDAIDTGYYYYTYTLSVLTDMDEDDTAYVVVYQHTGTQQMDVWETYTDFSGFWVCT